MHEVVITGLGIVTPAGNSAAEVLAAMRAGRTFAAPAAGNWAQHFPCNVCAEIKDFNPDALVREPKLIRLMSRDALLAVAAARLAMQDAAFTLGENCPPEDIGLFGATGLAGIPLSEVARLIRSAADERGHLDLRRFGNTALKQVRPVLSFKILSNMPLCFVSILEGIQGVNAIFNPWEGQGARAIAAAISAIQRGEATCALAGGCDVKTHELGFIALQQSGIFNSWERCGSGCVPAEGAAFIVLEQATRAAARNARVYAKVTGSHFASIDDDAHREQAYASILGALDLDNCHRVVSASDGDRVLGDAEFATLAHVGLGHCSLARAPLLQPKRTAGNLFAAAAGLQLAIAAATCAELPARSRVLANCFGYGSEQAAFTLEAP